MSYCYLVFFFSGFFYHLPFVTLTTYFIAFHILTCDFTSYMQSFIYFLYLKMISARSKRRRILPLAFKKFAVKVSNVRKKFYKAYSSNRPLVVYQQVNKFVPFKNEKALIMN